MYKKVVTQDPTTPLSHCYFNDETVEVVFTLFDEEKGKTLQMFPCSVSTNYPEQNCQ